MLLLVSKLPHVIMQTQVNTKQNKKTVHFYNFKKWFFLSFALVPNSTPTLEFYIRFSLFWNKKTQHSNKYPASCQLTVPPPSLWAYLFSTTSTPLSLNCGDTLKKKKKSLSIIVKSLPYNLKPIEATVLIWC